MPLPTSTERRSRIRWRWRIWSRWPLRRSTGAPCNRGATAGNPPASLIAMLFGPDMGIAYGAGQALPDAEARLANAFAQHDRIVHQVLESAAASAVSELPVSRDRVMRKVLAANFSEADHREADGSDPPGAQGLALQWLSDAWPGFILSLIHI